MNVKKWITMGICLILLAGLLTTPALALDSGVYTADMITSYYNPDTGNVDDGGTANAALGEGMCRSATGMTALAEVDGEDTWITVRLLLQSNCKNITFYTRTDYDSYSKVNYTVTAEDSANDSIDYRVKVSDAEVKLKCTMYVTPMGRDVLWYLYLDKNTLTPGNGDFVVNIDTKPEEPVVRPEEPSANSAEPVKKSSDYGASTPAMTENEKQEVGVLQNTDPVIDEGDSPEDIPEAANGAVTPESISAESESIGPEAEEQESADFADDIHSADSSGGGVIVGILAAVILAGGIIVAMIRRRHKE